MKDLAENPLVIVGGSTMETVKVVEVATDPVPTRDDEENHPPNRLAILIAGPWPGEEAMDRDIEAIVPALNRRGFRAEDLCILSRGPIGRSDVLATLRDVAKRTSDWQDGEVFLYVTGHGDFVGADAANARLAIRLAGSDRPLEEIGVFWEEVFTTLRIPARVDLTILPDT